MGHNNNWVNFAEIRSKVSLEAVILTYYRITTLKRDGPKLIGPCPIHNGDSPRAFHANLDKNVYHCFSRCQKGGNQLDFVAAKENISIRDAALKLQAFFLGGAGARPVPPPEPAPATPTPAAPAPSTTAPPAATATPPGPVAPVPTDASNGAATPQPETEEEGNPVLEVKLDLKSDHPHLIEERKLQPSTVQHFEVGYCSRGIMRGLIAIPIHDEDGDLVAYAGRRLKPSEIRDQGKYKFPKGFRKEVVLYNYHRAKEHQADKGLIIVEGFFAVMKLYEAGLLNVVAAMGASLSDYQIKLLSNAKEVILLFDGDEAGQVGATAAKEKLSPASIVRVIKLPPDTKPDSLSPKALRWLINGLQALDLVEVSFALRASASTPTP